MVAGERPAEGGVGLIPDGAGDVGDRVVAGAQQLGGKRHPPPVEV